MRLGAEEERILPSWLASSIGQLICVNVTMMLRRARRTESEVTANNPACGKGRAELATRNDSRVALSRKERKKKKRNEEGASERERENKRNIDITRDRLGRERGVVNTRGSQFLWCTKEWRNGSRLFACLGRDVVPLRPRIHFVLLGLSVIAIATRRQRR